MVLQQLLKAITKGWKTILVITLLAVAISLYISIYQHTAIQVAGNIHHCA